jgi:SAM-dependent methyltransferase
METADGSGAGQKQTVARQRIVDHAAVRRIVDHAAVRRILDHPVVRRLRHLPSGLPDPELLAAAGVFQGALALEPGGPSGLFAQHGEVPVYPRLAALDTLDFAEHTLWSGTSDDTEAPIRQRLIGEARELAEVADDSYDAVLASHVLEHLANPLGALVEWQRIVRPGGHVLLIVPHRQGTFDHRRAVTSLEHLIEDADRETGEDDRSHLEEILALHDIDRDVGAPSREVFEQRCRENLGTRGMHHHVFVSRTVVELCETAGLEVALLRPTLPFHVVCLCRVGAAGGTISQSELAKILRHSPFVSDRSEASRLSRTLRRLKGS